jgi:hypothetical protein
MRGRGEDLGCGPTEDGEEWLLLITCPAPPARTPF